MLKRAVTEQLVTDRDTDIIYIYIEGLSWSGVELYIACFECIDNTVWHTS